MQLSLKLIRRLLLLTVVTTAILPHVTTAGTIDASRPTVLVTGANRGIGLAFVQHYTNAGWNVIAAVRTPDRATELNALGKDYLHLVIEQLDVTDNDRITALADSYRNTPIDVLINNAGIYGSAENQAWGTLDAATFQQVLAVNVFAPMRMAEAFSEHVAASDQKKIVSITSGAGQVSRDGRAGGGMFYGISKASLNMAMRQVRAELEESGIIVALIAPGMVATDMLATARPEFFANANTPAQSVSGIAKVIEDLDQNYDGTPRNYDGSVIPW